MVGIPCADLRDRHLVIGSGILLVQMLCTPGRRGAVLVASHAIIKRVLDSPRFFRMVKSSIEIVDGRLLDYPVLLRIDLLPGNWLFSFVDHESITHRLQDRHSGASPTRTVFPGSRGRDESGSFPLVAGRHFVMHARPSQRLIPAIVLCSGLGVHPSSLGPAGAMGKESEVVFCLSYWNSGTAGSPTGPVSQ